MPDRVEIQDITVAASVPASNPAEVTILNVVSCQLVRLTLRIASGHAGQTGIAFGYGHNAVIPRRSGAFISGDDEVIIYDLTNYIAGPQWQAFVCNNDTQPHTWEARFEVNELIAIPSPVLAGALPPEQILSGAGELIGVA